MVVDEENHCGGPWAVWIRVGFRVYDQFQGTLIMDPYKILGVGRTAGENEIRHAFRSLAKELHPDVNPDNKAASERFKRVSVAYELLGDPKKRRAYDRGEIDENGEPRRGFAAHGMGGGAGFGTHPGHGGGGGFSNFGFGDIFDEVFSSHSRGGFGGGFEQSRSQGPPRGADVRYTLEVDFLESVRGTKKRVTLPEGGVLDLSVPEGVTDGQVLRLKGKGAASPAGGPSGDALVEIKVRAHPLFTRQDFDIHSEIPITLDEAVLGGKIEVSTIGGRVQLSLPAGTSSGCVFRLKGKGITNKRAGGQVGDHLVKVRIVLPSEPDEKLAELLKKWRETHRYDPGQR